MLLEIVNLPPTICYLWNQTESSTLPPGVTPYEILNRWKPDLSHLCVWGTRCFARVPTELQVKLGPYSHNTFFMGYQDGVKGYWLHDADTGTFFITRNIHFNENFPSTTQCADSDSDSDNDSPPAHLSSPAHNHASLPIMLHFPWHPLQHLLLNNNIHLALERQQSRG